MPTCFLVDNGSLKAASTLNLRRIAAELSKTVARLVEPVSLLHSGAVDAAELDGVAAEILEPAILRRIERGERDFVVLPAFFGPSRALTSYLPGRVERLRTKYSDVRVTIASSIFNRREGSDLRLARILAEQVAEKLDSGPKSAVVLADHGSPAPEVAYVRNFLAGQLSVLLGEKVARVAAASMERREGDEYRFNEPLLEEILREEGFNAGRVVVAMLFLSPGRHAGKGGDVEAICREAETRSPRLETVITDLVGNHPGLIPILADRLSAVLAQR